MRKSGYLALVLCSVAQAQTISVSVDVTSNVHPLSPLIFGVAFGDPTRNAQMHYTVDRWGGNSTTRYNWQTDFSNHAADWYYENIPNDPVVCAGTPPANSADAFVYCARAAGGQALMTMPTIGFTPRADSPATHPFFAGSSVAKYGAQSPTPWGNAATDFQWDPDAGSGFCDAGINMTGHCSADGLIVGNDWHDTSAQINPAFDQNWVAHLQATFGTAAAGGVKFYALDNEVMLWDSTHHDVHPNPASYNEIWNTTLDYAGAIKTQDPDALVTGPVTWGYPDLFTSAQDAANCNCSDGSDRQNHADLPFVAWYLQQVCANPLGGKRLVDYLDLHYYPQGDSVALSDADDATTAGLRLRSLKELYDPTWVSQSWIGQYLGDTDYNHYDKPNLIPRVRAWIDQYCPGTKLAITEYNWGNDDTSSGAVAQAEALAIFAREGVDLATRWGAPAANSLAERAFQIFLNYDGAGANVQGDSVGATSTNVDKVGAYGFNLDGQRTMLLLTNKDSASHDVTVVFNAARSGTWKLYGFDAAHALHMIGSGSIAGTTLSLTGATTLPAMSANLLVVPNDDGIFKDGFE